MHLFAYSMFKYHTQTKTKKRRPAQKKITNKTWLLWNIPDQIRETPPCRSTPERPFNWDVNKTWNLSFCLPLSWGAFLVRSYKEVFYRMWPGMFQSSQVLLVNFFFCAGHHFGVTWLTFQEDFAWVLDSSVYLPM